MDQWLRRELTNSAVAVRVEEAVRIRADETHADQAQADGVMLVRVVAALDPLAPICWEGVALWPDGLGAAFAAADAPLTDTLSRLVAAEAIAAWAVARPDRCEPPLLRMEARRQRGLLERRGWAGGVALLRYVLSPLGACRSPLLAGRMVTRTADLLPALEDAAGHADGRPSLPLDAEMAAFIVAREELRIDHDLAELGGGPSSAAGEPGGAPAVAQTRILARLQAQQQAGPVPKLAGWLAGELVPALAVWQSRSRRNAMRDAMKGCADAGNLANLAQLIDGASLREQDRQEADAARTAVVVIETAIAELRRTKRNRSENGRQIGQEVAAAAGVIALSCVAMWLLL